MNTYIQCYTALIAELTLSDQLIFVFGGYLSTIYVDIDFANLSENIH